MDWLVKNAQNRDVERQHLNKILQEIRNTLNELEARVARSTSEEQRIRDVVIKMVTTGNQSGINVTYNTTSKAIDFAVRTFTIQLTGAVTGTGTVTGLGNVSISTTLADSFEGVEEAPLDGFSYWRNTGTWVTVPFPLETLQYLTPGGVLVLDEELNWYARTIEGLAGEVVVTDGDGVADNPVIGLADVTVGVGGDLKKYGFDAKGRLSEEDDATTDDLPEGVTNLYFPEAPIDGQIYGRQDAAWVVAGGGGGAVDSVVAGTGIDVDATDPANPIVELDAATIASLALADTAIQPADLGTAAYEDVSAFEPAFAKGTIISGTGVSITGTLTDRLVGSGSITISATNNLGISLTAGEAISAGEFVYVAGDGMVYIADNSSEATAAVAFAESSVSAMASGLFLAGGLNASMSGLTPGETYALSTAGGVTTLDLLPTSSGTIIQVLGTALTVSSMLVDIQQAILRG